MKKILVSALTISPPVGIAVSIIVIGITIFSVKADAKYKPSPAILEISKVINRNQERVKEIDRVLASLNQERDGLASQTKVFRATICQTEKEACTKIYLDPFNSGVDLTPYLQ